MMKYSTYTWDLLLVLESASPASWKTTATFADSIPKNNSQEKAKNSKEIFNCQQIASYCLGLSTQNPGLRQLDLGPKC